MNQTRRGFLELGGVLAAAAQLEGQQRPAMWSPKSGILVNYSPANVAFAKQEGFTSIGFWAQANGNLAPARSPTPGIANMREDVRQAGLVCSVLGVTANHIDPDPAARKAVNDHTAGVIEIAGSWAWSREPCRARIRRRSWMRRWMRLSAFTGGAFPLCEKYKVRLVWEPWPEGPNVATGPVGYEALFKAFGDSPYVGIQFDPSHLVREFMDPYQAARDAARARAGARGGGGRARERERERERDDDVHLKDTEIKDQVLRRVGINPPSPAQWWRYRIQGRGRSTGRSSLRF